MHNNATSNLSMYFKYIGQSISGQGRSGWEGRGIIQLGPPVKRENVLRPRTLCQNRLLFTGPHVKININ